MRRKTRLAPVALLAVAALTATGCSGGDEPAPSAAPTPVEVATAPTTTPAPTTQAPATTTTARVTTTTSTPPAGNDAEVLAAVRSFWDLFIEVGGLPGPFDAQAVRARLVERTTGAQTTTLFQFFQGNAAVGYVVRGEIDLAPKVVSNDGATAKVRDCHDDRTGVYRASDGTRIDTDNPARHQVLMTLRKENGTWKVESTIDEGDGCAVS